MYVYCEPDKSDKLLQFILEVQQKIYQKLALPHRVVRIATGDLSAPAYEKYDIEYYSPADKKYRELTSCSNCTDFQTRRLAVRYKDQSGKNQFAHSLNGTAVTSTRTLIAILENYQLRDGSIEVPKVLQKYYGDKKL
jgi:seryl-tRNA synthetase